MTLWDEVFNIAFLVFFFKQKTAYELRISDWSSDVCSSDLNPFPGSPVWALGFRVPQGIVYASNGKIYSAEHGNLADDEVNLIEKGANYGYPNVSGICDQPAEKIFCAANKVKEPLIAWTPTIAPAGLAYYNSTAIPQ